VEEESLLELQGELVRGGSQNPSRALAVQWRGMAEGSVNARKVER